MTSPEPDSESAGEPSGESSGESAGAAARVSARLRREPPRFRRVTVAGVRPLSARLVRITFAGAELDGLQIDEPAASVRLLLPGSATAALVMPIWNGNEFLLPGGRRPTIRTFTPRRSDPVARELDLDVVLHGTGRASEWAVAAEAGRQAAISGPGRGYTIDRDAPAYLLAGDESAIPAISQLLESLPPETPTQVEIEVPAPEGRVALPEHPNATIEWHDLAPGAPPGDALIAAVRRTEIAPGTRVWAAGEAAAVQRIRRYLFNELAIPRGQTTVRGYWKHGRAGDDDDEK
ncbi:MAG: FAD-binding 9 siderophore-interacting domain protein [Actinomycetia bacterium]|nr:FAD-binding 9 siderophore-interacting domain protein [Actinomycetes bacterium]